jgi:hypothetical protein
MKPDYIKVSKDKFLRAEVYKIDDSTFDVRLKLFDGEEIIMENWSPEEFEFCEDALFEAKEELQ